MLICSQYGKRNVRSDCGKGSSFPETAAPQGEVAVHRQGEQASGTLGEEGARLAELFKRRLAFPHAKSGFTVE